MATALGLSPRTGSLESLREHNLLRVIDVLLERGVASRADIARHTGLSRTTVSSLVTDLIDRGLISERVGVDQRDGQSGAGRPPVLLALDRSAGAAIGIDMGHSHLRVAVADLSHAVLAQAERQIDVDQSAAESMAAAAELVEVVLERGRRSARPRHQRRPGHARPDQPSHRRRRVEHDHARLGRRARRRRDGGPPRACRSSSRTTPTSARWARRCSAPAWARRRSSTSRSAPASAPA